MIRFDAFELDLVSRELYKRGRRLKLQDQPFQILAALLERPGELVTREQLHQRLWPGESVASMDDGLNAAVRRLRSALSDSAGHSKYIETLPRRGYRFIGSVDNGGADHPQPPYFLSTDPGSGSGEARPSLHAPDSSVAIPRPSLVPRRAASSPAVWIAVGAVCLTALVIAAMATRPRPSPASAPRTETSFVHLTRAAGVELNPALSPDGLWVAYVAQEGGAQDIFLQSVGSQVTTNLTATPGADDRQPAFSPDGEQIAFRSERDGGGIFLMSATGGAVRRVSDFGFDPAWSPDGKHLVVASEGVVNPLSRTSTSSLWRIEIATGSREQIFDGDAIQPSWSPGGTRIAFWRTLGNSGQRDIATIPANGGPAVHVTDDPAIDWSPVWSPDGKHLYFSSDRGGSMNLWRIAIDERSGVPRGTPEAVTTPARWSGDLSIGAGGRVIAFTAADPRSNILRIAFDPESETVSGGTVPITEASMSLLQPAVSPDGEWVVYRTELEQEDLYLSRTDGSETRKLTDDPAHDRGPAWSPDGERIAFYSDRSGKYEAWSIRPDGTGLEQLTSFEEHAIFFPLWLPDSAGIVVNTPFGSFTVDLASEREARSIQPLPKYPEADRAFRASSVSEDGRWLAGTLYSVQGKRIPGVVVYSMDERRYQTLSTFGSWPTWLSDARRVVFSDRNKLYLGDRTSGEVREIFSVDGQIPFGVAVSRDDRAIYFAHASEESDIWLATMK